MPTRSRACRLAAAFATVLAAFVARAADDWVPFDPPRDDAGPGAVLDLRGLNESFAGEHGFIRARGGHFERSGDGAAVRFWGVNGPPREPDAAGQRRAARRMARLGVNLARLHGPVFDESGAVDASKVRKVREQVDALRAEGVYAHLSIYFPLWFAPKADCAFLRGYDGRRHPFAALFFNPAFQERYREWWRAVLATPDASGKRLVDDPAVMGVELVNEDSLFFWTFNERELPAPQLEMIEARFGAWLAGRHGSIDAALDAWKSPRLARDNPAAGRVAFRPLWNLANERTARDRETAAFLLEVQSAFYRETTAFLRGLGFKGVVTASNWSTADNRVLGPLEKLSYLAGDFTDRHGYVSAAAKGEASEWSLRAGQTYADRSALRFDPEEPGKPRSINHPAMDAKYGGKPSMLSEIAWNRPNRHRGEAPLFLAAYGALQDTDAIVHFAFDGADWSTKPNFWMQPWTLMSPSQAGQFPAAALIFRQGLVRTGDVVAREGLPAESAAALAGTRVPLDASLDELRLKDVPTGTVVPPGKVADPLLHLVGRTEVNFDGDAPALELASLAGRVDHDARTVASSTGELRLDYGKGVLRIDAPRAQGASGNLAAAGEIATADLAIASPLDVVHVVVVPLDGRPLRASRRMLVQAMTEERPTGWRDEDAGNGRRRIVEIGRDPWQVRAIEGTVRFKRPDAASLRFTALDGNGRASGPAGTGAALRLRPGTAWYLAEAGTD